jgi:hypothetical protein
MIPHGVTPADDWAAAEIFNESVGHWRNSKHWARIPGLQLLSGSGQRPRRVWAKVHLKEAADWEEIPEEERPKKPTFSELPTEEHPLDLLTEEEGRLSLPEERRPAKSTWTSYKNHRTKSGGRAARFPEPDVIFADVEYWYRQTFADWLANRPGKGGGRLVGSRDTRPREKTAPRFQLAEQRRERARTLLQGNPQITPKDVALQLDVTERTAQRILAELRTDHTATS